MILASLTTLGELDMPTKETSDKTPRQFDELDFEMIKETAKEAHKKLLLKKTEAGLTSAEKNAIPVYIKDMASYIKKYAKQGRFKFEYDCKNLTNNCFDELAKEFKERNPLFFVVTDYGTKTLIVEWTGKNEC
jgi:hypothetical protein